MKRENGGAISSVPAQRFEISCFDFISKCRIVIAWTRDELLAGELAAGADLVPMWSDARIEDRQVLAQ